MPAATPKPVAHVVVILMENKAEKSVIGSSHAPYLNQLADACGQATAYHGVSHPSLPNYLALTGGDTFGVTDDGLPPTHPIHAATIFGQLHGNWRAYQESMTLPCQKSVRDHLYAPRHNPAAYFTALTDCQLHDVPLPTDPTFDAAFTFVTPNLQDDMHDGSIERGDAWVSAFVAKVVASTQYQEGSLALFVTWDENDGPFHVAGNQIPLLVVAPSVVPGTRVATSANHYSLLATWQDLLGLSRIGRTVGAASLAPGFNL